MKYKITGRNNGGYVNDFGDLVEYESKIYHTRFKFIKNILVFYCKLFYDWVIVENIC